MKCAAFVVGAFLAIAGCASNDGVSDEHAEVELSSGTVDGLPWTAVFTEDDDGQPCIGFETADSPLGRSRTCAVAGDGFPETRPVLDHISIGAPGWSGVGFVFLTVDVAAEVQVSFDDGDVVTATFSAVDGLPSGLVAASLLGPECVQPVRVMVVDGTGQTLNGYDLPTSTDPSVLGEVAEPCVTDSSA